MITSFFLVEFSVVFVDAASFEAQILKGDFSESSQDWSYSSKRDVPFLWTGEESSDFGLHLNGFTFAAGMHGFCFQAVLSLKLF